MEDIGHLEFGELHRPIWFEGMDETCSRWHPGALDYWVAYWIRAFQHILRFKDEVLFVSYDRLCDAGSAGIHTVAERLDIPYDQPHGVVPSLRAPSSYKETAKVTTGKLVEEAEVVHGLLLTYSVV